MPLVTLVQTGVSFEAGDDETIMEAAERAGIFMVHSCLSGTCRSCMTRVISGEVEHDPEYLDDLNIDDYEVEEGYRLLCSAFARTDVELDK
ncbi:MAG TPA: 2Fe-2S iron-sulfur cluster binding domain-containing protein [Aggregatilinea sp.]|uniref:2Fe-2S iron-sulfur cluster-binding protein n=1 Tax=Aggregatilinea sp. TaxID=2806333 RepID=UPI002BC6E9DF|nr:2Fe-2S iron-sulfur cluster binding domain-containing protein [Aggregatilinea sp.]HML20640.1 2Fe-2S iron-sulfur cluster binding domain-containing protein [Aggregatilinea sp.]